MAKNQEDPWTSHEQRIRRREEAKAPPPAKKNVTPKDLSERAQHGARTVPKGPARAAQAGRARGAPRPPKRTPQSGTGETPQTRGPGAHKEAPRRRSGATRRPRGAGTSNR